MSFATYSIPSGFRYPSSRCTMYSAGMSALLLEGYFCSNSWNSFSMDLENIGSARSKSYHNEQFTLTEASKGSQGPSLCSIASVKAAVIEKRVVGHGDGSILLELLEQLCQCRHHIFKRRMTG